MDFIRESIALLRMLSECMSIAAVARRCTELGEFLCSALDWQGGNR